MPPPQQESVSTPRQSQGRDQTARAMGRPSLSAVPHLPLFLHRALTPSAPQKEALLRTYIADHATSLQGSALQHHRLTSIESCCDHTDWTSTASATPYLSPAQVHESMSPRQPGLDKAHQSAHTPGPGPSAKFEKSPLRSKTLLHPYATTVPPRTRHLLSESTPRAPTSDC